MSTTTKIMLAAMVLLIIATAIFYAVKTAELSRRAAEIARLSAELAECGGRVRDADRAIERQNAAIDKTRVDTVVVERLIKQAEKKYVEVREVVIQSIEKDTSLENKIGNIDFALRRFHGVGVRSEGGGKD